MAVFCVPLLLLYLNPNNAVPHPSSRCPDVFHPDPDFVANEEKYKAIKTGR